MSPEPVTAGVGMTVTGPAIFGHDPDQILCWKPCCKSPVRLRPDEFGSWLPVVVLCDRPRCQGLWTVEFPEVPAGHDRVSIWRLVRCPRGYG
ncbi:MAG: hypothetical protein ACRDYX_17285 [Egibacteraceae bacterium]